VGIAEVLGHEGGWIGMWPQLRKIGLDVVNGGPQDGSPAWPSAGN
jgi:hypothetical protein